MFTVLGLWEQWQKQQIIFGTMALFWNSLGNEEIPLKLQQPQHKCF